MSKVPAPMVIIIVVAALAALAFSLNKTFGKHTSAKFESSEGMPKEAFQHMVDQSSHNRGMTGSTGSRMGGSNMPGGGQPQGMQGYARPSSQ